MNKKQILIIALIVVGIITAIVFVFQKRSPTKERETSKETITELEQIDQIDTSDWKVYRNEEYGFEISFPNTWKGYEVKSGSKNIINRETLEEYTLIRLYFSHPQKISNKGRSAEVGFSIGIFDRENWLISEGWKKLGENSEKVFGSWLNVDSAPDDLYDRLLEIKFILGTFKIL